MIIGVQAAMARAALGWRRDDLAEASGVSPATLRRFEAGKATVSVTALKVEQAFMANGVEFSSSPGKVCVCLKTE